MRFWTRFSTTVSIAVALLSGGIFHVPFVQAAALEAESSAVLDDVDAILEPGQLVTVKANFTNTGTLSWKNDGQGYVSLYTFEPKYRISACDPGTWLSPEQIRRIEQESVLPGGRASISFALRAPQEEGDYTETFSLASEDTAWISGGVIKVSFTVKVKENTSKEEVTTTQTQEVVQEEKLTSASSLASVQTAQVKAGKYLAVNFLLKNTGETSLRDLTLRDTSSYYIPRTNEDLVFGGDQRSPSRILGAINDELVPGSTLAMTGMIFSPEIEGEYRVPYAFFSEGEEIPGSSGEIILRVIEGDRARGDALPRIREDVATEEVFSQEEPDIRVGVLLVDEETNWEVVIGSYESDVDVYTATGELLQEIPKGTFLRAAYEHGAYVYGSGGSAKTTSSPIRFIPRQKNAVLEIKNFDRRITRDTQYANNTFRNILELRYNEDKDRTWIINELPIEFYLRGLAETSNSSPEEFQKALLTAARTYAYYHMLNPGKHAAEGYHVDAYRDQVYWGYGQEERNPGITQGVEASRGTLVFYGDELAVTSYFSRSDGRTRNWSDVWGRDVPYAVSVPVPCDVGKTLWGHGVGMSASGAICMANEGSSWEDILHYFYTGVTLKKTWK